MSSAKSQRFWPVVMVIGGLLIHGLSGWIVELIGEGVFLAEDKPTDALGGPIQAALDDFGLTEGADAVFIHAYAPDLSSRKRLFGYLDRHVGDYKLFLDREVLTTAYDQRTLLADHKQGECSAKFAAHLTFPSEFMTPFSMRVLEALVTYPMFGPRGDLIGYVDWHFQRGAGAKLGQSKLSWQEIICAKLEAFADAIAFPFERYVLRGGG